jgi:hypothetical protein
MSQSFAAATASDTLSKSPSPSWLTKIVVPSSAKETDARFGAKVVIAIAATKNRHLLSVKKNFIMNFQSL